MFACAVMDSAELVTFAAARLGMRIPETFVSRKWFTSTIRPWGDAPGGRSMEHCAKAGSVKLAE